LRPAGRPATLAAMSRFLTPHAASLPSTVPFTGPETLERRQGQPFRARLGANESLFGPSPAAIAAMEQAAAEAWMYGDPENHDLKQALAARHGCAPANIVVGPGIDGLLGLTCRLTLAAGTPVVTSLGAYPTFLPRHRVWRRADPRALSGRPRRPRGPARRRPGARRPKLLYLANPDNPMGSHHPAAHPAGPWWPTCPPTAC
jgi:histidinol-phosphate aminotransferase